MRRILIGLTMMLLIAGSGVLVGCGSGDDPGGTSAASPAYSADSRKAAAAFSGTTLDGVTVASDAFKGRPTALIFWASW